MQRKKFALAGNPNSGKTTLFNTLTGSTAHVGNWPGVTVDKKEGTYKKGEVPVDIVDLPGIYSLSPYTPEEVIARNHVLNDRPDCIINIVDATNLERNLYLTTQLLEVDIPLVVALNMTDVIEKNGDKIDVVAIERKLGVPVVEISALRGANVDRLMERAIQASNSKRDGKSVLQKTSLYAAIENAEIAFKLNGVTSPLFHAIKLVEKDGLEVEMHPKEAAAAREFLAKNGGGKAEFEGDAEAEIADARYRYIAEHLSTALKRGRAFQTGELTKSDKADRVLTHKWFGIPIFLVILFAVFHLTFSENLLYLGSIPALGDFCEKMSETTFGCIVFSADGINSPGAMLFYLMNVLTSTIGDALATVMENADASAWAVDFVCSGVWGGIASVLSFVPQILVLFLWFSILEDSGYMARVAFIFDRAFRRFGVSGRAFMPMIMGFGCSVPAMMNTRTLAHEREREATIRVIPFFSCGAKLPILTAIAGAIVARFGVGNEEVITYSMYLVGMLTAVLALLIMRNTTMRGETPPFIMELPAYRAPGVRNLSLHLWDKLKHYIQKAFTVILVSCIVIWFLSNFSWDWSFLVEECVQYVRLKDGAVMELGTYLQSRGIETYEGQTYLMHLSQWQAGAFGKITGETVFANITMNESILGSLGKLFQPLFTPIGFGSQLNGAFGWVFVVAAVTGLIAKENVVATFGSLAACVTGAVVASETGVDEVAAMISATGIGVPGLIAFIVFNMTTIPCFAAVASAKGEIGKGKFRWTLLFWMITSYLVSAIIYTVGEWTWTVAIWAVVAVAVIAFIVLFNKLADRRKRKENT